MSTTIDEKVVEMRFDNKHFESNVKETMSTLDKFKQKLNLTGASKGLENINTSANKVNMSGMTNALDSVQSRFSALEIIGTTALVNIANSAVNAGKRIIKALTIDPVTDGWREYEMTLNAIQTTMAGTGKTSEEVAAELKKLDEYADKTVYSTADMLNNLPKFTNAGVALEDATTAMIGIANATALAGGDASKASIAFYNLGQAIGTGYLTRMDYNSINNAGIATMEWKNQMVEAALAYGTLKKVGDDMYQAGNKTLTLQQLFIDGLQEQWATTDVMMTVFQAYGDETTDVGEKAYAAAQDIKTFTMMMDSLKATAGTGWKDTWEIVFGDLEEAKQFWTGLTNFISNIITKMADFRNNLLEGALGKGFKGIKKSLNTIKKPLKTVADAVKTVSMSLEELNEMSKKVIRGDFGNGKKRFNELTEAGYNYYAIQNKVNETLKDEFRYSQEIIDAQYQKLSGKKTETKATEEMTAADAEYLKTLTELSDEELRNLDLTEEQIAALRELKKYADKTGLSIEEFIANIDEIDGRWLLINSFKNAAQGLVTIFKSIKDAWVEVIGSINSNQLFNVIAAIHKFSTYLTVSDKAAKNFKDTFSGIFSILDLIFLIVGGPIKIALTILGQFFKAMDISLGAVLDFSGGIGRTITKFHDWIEKTIDFTALFEKLAPYVKKAAKAFKEWLKGLKNLDAIKNFASYIAVAKEAFVSWLTDIKNQGSDVASYIFQGLYKGLKFGSKAIVDLVIEIGKYIIDGIKKVLGIHSPSTVFYDIGKNIIQGLYNGLKEYIIIVYDLIKNMGLKLVEIVKNLDIGSIFVMALSGGMLYGIVQTTKIFEALGRPLEGLGNLLYEAGEVLDVFKGTLKSFSFGIKAKAIQSIAIAVAILAGSIAVLALLDVGKMWSAFGAIAGLIVLLGVLSTVVGKWGPKESIQFGKLALSLMGLGVAMAIMAIALRTISGIDPKNMNQAVAGFVMLAVAMVGMLAVLGHSGKNMVKLGGTLLGMSFAILLMSRVVKSLGAMDKNELIQGGNAITGLTILIVGLMAATKLLTGSKNVSSIAGTIASVASALLMMIFVVKIAGGMDDDELAQGTEAITKFALLIVGLMAATKLISGSKNVGKIGSAILGIGGALLMMAVVTKILGGMEVAALAKGIIATALLGAIVAGLVYSTKLVSGKDLAKVGATVFLLSVALATLGLTAALLSLMKVDSLAKGVIAVGFLSLMVMGLMKAAHSVPQKIMGTIIAITAAIGVLAIAVGVLSAIKTENLAKATIAMSMVLGVFALVIKSTDIYNKSLGVLITLTVAIGVLAGAIFLLGQLPANQALSSAAALSMLLLAMSASLAILSLIKGNALAGIGSIALLTLIVGGLALILAGMSKLNINSAMTYATALSTLLLAMSGALVVLGIVGMMGPAAFIGIGALATLIVGLTAVVVGIGALMEKFPSLQTFLSTGISTLIQLASGLGQVIGAFVNGILTGIASGLPAIGANLSMFMMNLAPFIAGAKMIDGNVLAGIAILSASIIALTVAELINGIASFLSGGTSFAVLGTQLSAFMINALPFIMLSKQIDPAIMTGIKNLAEAILILTGANVLESLTSWITGGNSLANFGTQLSELGTSLKSFINSLGEFTPAQVATVDCAAKAIKTLAAVAKELPNEGGLWGALCGENSLATFGSYLPGLATNLNGFVTNLGAFTDKEVDTARCAGEAIKHLAAAADEIPNEGGLWAAIVGDNSLATFGAQLPGLGTNLNSFVTNLGTFTDKQVTTVECAGNAIATLAKAAKDIPNEGGLWAKIAGDNSLATFAGHLPDLGVKLKEFVKSIGEFSDPQLASVASACDAIRSIASLGQIDIKDTGSKLETFGSNMVKFAKKTNEFVTKIGEVGAEGIALAVQKTAVLIKLAQSVATVNSESLKTFGESLKAVAKDGVSGFAKEIAKTEPKDAAVSAIKEIVTAVIKGADSKKADVQDKFEDIVEKAIDGLDDKKHKTEAKDAGKDLCQGLINGLQDKEKLDAVYNAAYALGQLAVKGEKDGQQSNSPSKATEKAGIWLGEGLIIGIRKMTSKVYSSGKTIGEEATNSLSTALNSALNLLNSDMDAQPTIRPVLDLSDVQSGVGVLNGMFNNGPSIGVMANLRAISSGIDAKLQNGSNYDVVSAIDKLGKSLGNGGGNTYNINGVTYDDGSNISDAVEALIRAAQVERRI